MNSQKVNRLLFAQSPLLNVLMLSGDSLEIDDNLMSWEITDVTNKLIKVALEFAEPLKVSQGDSPDILVLQAQLC